MAPSTVGGESRPDFEQAQLRLARLGVRGGNSLAEALRATAELAAQTLAVERVGIWLFVEGRRAIRCYHLFERSRREHSEGVMLHAADFPIYFRALEELRTIDAGRAREHDLTRELRDAYLEPLGIVSMLDAPIYRGGAVVGVICHEHVGAPRMWTAEERAFAASAADSVALKLESAARQDAESAVLAHEAYLVESRRLEALGRMAAGVAHDFRNLLTVVEGFAELLVHSAQASPETAGQARQILKAAEGGRVLVDKLLTFGRDGARATRVIEVGPIAEDRREMLGRAAGRGYTVSLSVVHPVGRVFMEPGELERILLNLVLNARDAMPGGGEITIEVSETRVDDGKGAAGVYVVVRVMDRGVGIDPSARERLFEPFYTTKPEGHGSGLGLAVVHGIVQRCGGFIHLDSTPGNGTDVRVYLPRVASERGDPALR